MKIGIFGGSYNPPHKMHLKIAKDLISKGYVDKIIFVPTGSKYKYKDNLLNDNDRLTMLKIIAKHDERFLISDYELKDYVVYTCETLAYFKEQYPNDEIYFICGADNLSYIDKWKDGINILKNYKILVIDRKTNNLEEILERFKNYKKNIITTDIELSNISSTNIREKLKQKKYDELKQVLDDDVLNYIIKKKLYED